mmetsp:Transcript_38256/g.108150  ORF Transcript_38256/g.108150 Transcript_38256/m.108150 type:complete len:1127 (-) Transcript_38256:27-3407(-)
MEREPEQEEGEGLAGADSWPSPPPSSSPSVLQLPAFEEELAPASLPGEISVLEVEDHEPLFGEEAFLRSPGSIPPHLHSKQSWHKWGLAAAGSVLVIVAISVAFKSSKSGKELQKGNFSSSFEVVAEANLTAWNFTATIYRHKNTGAEVVSIQTVDHNKAGAIVFRTPVTNNRGTPHVLEHCVLGGSKKYPTKAPPPIDRLEESSLFSFLNAETYNERTLFPVASPNLKDFHNLMEVYIDAVFNPMFLEEERIFKQEGWHHSLQDASKPEEVDFVGVVLSEMRGALADSEARLELTIDQQLYPATTYSHHSGGIPEELLELTFEQTKAYYHQFYHPSNARFWFYGDDPVQERLRLVHEALKESLASAPSAADSSKVRPQPRFTVPRKYSGVYPAAYNTEKSYVVVAWMLGGEDGLPLVEELAMRVLEDLLLGDETAPLRKELETLKDTQIWRGSGMEPMEEERIQPRFTIGLESMAISADSDESLGPTIHMKIMNTLRELSHSGFDMADIEASLVKVEMGLRRGPAEDGIWGVTLLRRMAGKWIWGRGILEAMAFDRTIQELRSMEEEMRASGKGLFQTLIAKHLLENMHRADITLAASTAAAEKQEEEAKRQREDTAWQFPANSGRAKALVAATLDLVKWQESPDSPEAVASVPTLELTDVDRSVPKGLSDITTPYEGCTLLQQEQPTGGLLFASLALDLNSVEWEQVHLLPVLTAAMDRVGFKDQDANQRFQLEGRTTGGITYSTFVETRVGSESDPAFYLVIRGMAMAAKAGDLLVLIQKALLELDLESREADEVLARYVRDHVADLQQDLQDNIFGWARRKAATMMSSAGWLDGQLRGFIHLERMVGLRNDVARQLGPKKLCMQLRKLLSGILYKHGTVLSLTGDSGALAAAQHAADKLLEMLRPVPGTSAARKHWLETTPPANVVLLDNSQSNNNIVAQAHVLPDSSAFAALQPLSRFLLTEVRMKRGAYGAYASMDLTGQVFEFSSYLDPGMDSTLHAFHSAPQHLRQAAKELTRRRLDSAILGGLRELEPYRAPAARGEVALQNFLRNVTGADLQARRDHLFAATANTFEGLAGALEDAEFVVIAAASEETAHSSQKPDGTPTFDQFIILGSYFCSVGY